MLEPYCPVTSDKILGFLGRKGEKWDKVGTTEGEITVGPTELLFQKLEDDRVEELRARYSGSQAEREAAPKEKKAAKTEKKNKKENTVNNENLEDLSMTERFAKKVILKVSKITEIENHPNGDILYILGLDTGEEEKRTIVSSIVPYYKKEELLGHNIVLVSNLKPANFRGVKTKGMLLAATEKGDENHETCEVIFADDFEVGTVLEFDGQEPVEKITTYLKPNHFFDMPMETINGEVCVDGKPLGFGGKHLTVKKYINGNVG